MPEPVWFLDDTASTRFPVYCRGNVGEIVPFAVTPLSSSLTTPAFEDAFGELFGQSGAFSDAELSEPATTGGVFGAYLYFNLSFMRSFAARAPGMTVRDVDTQVLGGGDSPPYVPGPGDRSVLAKLRIGRGLVQMFLGRKKADLDGERAEMLAWAASMPAEPTDDEIVALARSFPPRMAHGIASLLEAGFGSAIPASLLERMAARAVAAEPGLLVKAVSGIGGIETTKPALDLWALGRAVAASPALTAAFDEGIGDVQRRLEDVDDASVRDFQARFDTFVTEHGHRGPNEVELASDTWGTNPRSALAVIERLRHAPESADPARSAERLAGERADAQARLKRGVVAPLRPIVGRLLAINARGTAKREQAKATLVIGLAALRRALLHGADRLVRDGHLADRTQFFMATVDELPQLLADPTSVTPALAARRSRYEELNALMPPFSFVGAIPDPSTWEPRAGSAATRVTGARTLTGIGVSAGRVTGRARIITDPSDPRGLEPDEILVAPLTDPAWTPLFLAAAGVVVDIGALQSHAAVVARELGIPAVVSVSGASKELADGDMLDVDGDRGLVTVLESASSA